MIRVNQSIKAVDLSEDLERFWKISEMKIRKLEARLADSDEVPVITKRGQYSGQEWTQWTLGFRYGSALLQFEASGDDYFLELGKSGTMNRLEEYVTHFGVHDHGFNIGSTFGNLYRMGCESIITCQPYERDYYALALKCSGAVQARRWTSLGEGKGFIHSFHGPHSLFIDSIRSLRSLATAYLLGHQFVGENDREECLIERLIQHFDSLADYLIFFGDGRDIYDERGRTAHEGIFNVKNGSFRCVNSQQGYSGFTTWTRGQAWAILGCAELLALFTELKDRQELSNIDLNAFTDKLQKTAIDVSEHFLAHVASDGMAYWDTGAPNIEKLLQRNDEQVDPNNEFEPVDSSASAIACQGLLILADSLKADGKEAAGFQMRQAGLTILKRLFSNEYLSNDESHEGLLLHSIYHRPFGWDYQAEGSKVPSGEACMWGDYHIRELALLLQRELNGKAVYRFHNGLLS